FEYHAPVGDRKDLSGRSVRRRLPRVLTQLQAPAPLLAPLRVQEDDQVQTAMQRPPRMIVEIDVPVEILATEILVRAAADVIRIVNEIVDGGDLAHPAQELARADQPVELGIRPAEPGNVGDHRLAPHLAELI